MYICLCSAVTDRCIRQMVDGGCHDVREIMNRSNAGKTCGACVCDVKKIVAHCRQQAGQPISGAGCEGAMDKVSGD